MQENGQFDLSELERMERSGNWVAEPKCDGQWGVVFGTTKGNRIFSNTQKEKKNIPLPPLEPGTAIVGELGFGSQSATLKAEKLGHKFVDVFDIIYFEGEPVWQASRKQRRITLEEIYSDIWVRGTFHQLPYTDYFCLLSQWTSNFAKHFLEAEEGIVLKPISGGELLLGQKDEDWWKAKKQRTDEFVVLDWEVSTSILWKGLAESIKVGMYDHGVLREMTSVGAMTEYWRREFSQHFEKYRGKVGEISHFGQFKSGHLRHSGFVRMRDDKEPKSCIFVWKG